LNIAPYIDELAQIRVSHVTITVNAIIPEIAEKIYSWVRFGKRVFHPKEGVKVLLEKQIEAIRLLKEKGIVVKVNSIIIPEINDKHIPAVAKKMSEMKVDILNCIPYYPNEGSAFGNIPEPSKAVIQRIREEAGKYIPQMHHCTRCRADAVGLLGEGLPPELMEALKTCEATPDPPRTKPVKIIDNLRPYVAVASMEGVLVNQHLGEAYQVFVYGKKNGLLSLIETRQTPEPGSGMKRWEELADIMGDCRTLLVSGIGPNPRQVLTRKGIEVIEIEGLIEEAVRTVYDGGSLKHLAKRKMAACGSGCAGTGVGCG